MGRLASSNINNNFNTNYEYITNGKRTSLLVKSIGNNNDKYSYKYDDLGNLLFKKVYKLNTYNQLKQDKYEYANTNWCDQLTKFNDDIITYDGIGNPLTIGEDITLNWINGRQLNSYTDSNNVITYKYNKDGIRTSKIINNVETKYYLEGSSIIIEKTGDNMLYYLYSNGKIVGFKYNDNIYYYMKNNQDDIVGILDSNYNIIAKYIYDSCGNIISITDGNGNDVVNDLTHIANINPFRYRGYYYDKEINLYYLNSRYYNPIWGRFINADGIINSSIDFQNYNLYNYCSNNYINYIDSSGKLFLTLIKAAIATYCIAKVAITVASNIYIRATNKDLSSDMFNKSMYDAKTSISKSIENKIIEKSKNSPSLKNEVKNCIAKSNQSQFKECRPSDDFQFKPSDGDTHYSIQHADVSISGEKEDDKWDITIKMSDTYDFTKFRADGLSTSNLANNLGYVMQKIGMLETYDWDVQYSYIYEE